MDEILASSARLNQAAADFLKADVATALTFSGIALQAADSVKKQRNRQSARKAYDTVLRLMEKVPLTDVDARILARKLRRLKSELASLGEFFGEPGKSQSRKTV